MSDRASTIQPKVTNVPSTHLLKGPQEQAKVNLKPLFKQNPIWKHANQRNSLVANMEQSGRPRNKHYDGFDNFATVNVVTERAILDPFRVLPTITARDSVLD